MFEYGLLGVGYVVGDILIGRLTVLNGCTSGNAGLLSYAGSISLSVRKRTFLGQSSTLTGHVLLGQRVQVCTIHFLNCKNFVLSCSLDFASFHWLIINKLQTANPTLH